MASLPIFVLFLVFTFAAHAQEGASWQVTSYDINVQLPPDASATRTLNVQATITARNVGRGAGNTLTARLAKEAEVTAALVGGATATFTKGSETRLPVQRAIVRLPNSVAPNGTTSVRIDYRLPIGDNSGLAALSPEEAQFLPLAYWYPTPNTAIAPRGLDTAPFRITVNGMASGNALVSAGRIGSSPSTYESIIYGQPFFLTGKRTTIEGTGDARGISAHLYEGATAEERTQAENLIKTAAAARAFFAELFGVSTPDAPLRLIAVRRAAGFNSAGTLLLDASVFRRDKLDSATALLIGETAARMWLGGAAPVRGDSVATTNEGGGIVREGLVRHFALRFIEKQFGADARQNERRRMLAAHAAIARRDAPLLQTGPLDDTYLTSMRNKGATVWSLIAEAAGDDRFIAAIRGELQNAARGEGSLTLNGIRNALNANNDERLSRLMEYAFEKPTDTDLIVGLPQQKAGATVAALRNDGSSDVRVTIVATTERGERLTTEAAIPARDFGEARFPTTNRIMRIEIDPLKLYPQIDYTNDYAPRPTGAETDTLAEARAAFARGEYAKAETIARAALARTPHDDDARIVLARALLGANRFDEAEKEFRTALAEPLPSPATLAWSSIGFGEIAARRNAHAEAARYFDRAVEIDAEYASTLAARAARLRAETAAANLAPPVDEAARAFIAKMDAAIKSGRKAEIDTLLLAGELTAFAKGVVGNQPEVWQMRVLRTEPLDAVRMAVDVQVTARTLGVDSQGPAVLVLTRTSGDFKLADVPIFEVR